MGEGNARIRRGRRGLPARAARQPGRPAKQHARIRRAVTHPRRNHLRLLAAAIAYGATASGATVGALSMCVGGGGRPAVALAALAAAAGVLSWRRFRLSERHRVGAESEERVRRQLNKLRGEGWKVRHGLQWPRGGDIDHALTAPNGLLVAVETKTRRYTARHVERTLHAAQWLRSGRRAPAIAVLVLAGERGVWRIENDVVVVSADRLLDVLRSHGAAATRRAA